MTVLVTAASKHGATWEIAEAIGAELSERGVPAVVMAPEEVDGIGAYDAVVLGSAVYAGHWMRSAKALVERAARAWDAVPVWLFSSGPVGDPEAKVTKEMEADPVDLAVVRATTGARDHRMFPGRLEPSHLPLLQRTAMKMFRSLRGDFRNWDAVRAWADEIADELQASSAR